MCIIITKFYRNSLITFWAKTCGVGRSAHKALNSHAVTRRPLVKRRDFRNLKTKWKSITNSEFTAQTISDHPVPKHLASTARFYCRILHLQYVSIAGSCIYGTCLMQDLAFTVRFYYRILHLQYVSTAGSCIYGTFLLQDLASTVRFYCRILHLRYVSNAGSSNYDTCLMQDLASTVRFYCRILHLRYISIAGSCTYSMFLLQNIARTDTKEKRIFIFCWPCILHVLKLRFCASSWYKKDCQQKKVCCVPNW